MKTLCSNCSLPVIVTADSSVIDSPCPRCRRPLGSGNGKGSGRKKLACAAGGIVLLGVVACLLMFAPTTFVAQCINSVLSMLNL